MATKQFHINTEPHVAEIGDVKLLFSPEIEGAEFASAYARLMERQEELTADGAENDPATIGKLDACIREFINELLLEESREDLAKTRIPLRILTSMLQWIAEIYGGGPGNALGTSS